MKDRGSDEILKSKSKWNIIEQLNQKTEDKKKRERFGQKLKQKFEAQIKFNYGEQIKIYDWRANQNLEKRIKI